MKVISVLEKVFQPVTILVETEEELKTLYMKMNLSDSYLIQSLSNDIYKPSRTEMITKNTHNIWQCIYNEIKRQGITI